MTSEELRSEILREIDQLPEFMLPHVLNFIQQIKAKHNEKTELEEFIRKSIEEDRELLQKLDDYDTNP
jgi:hypothetical protein